MRPIPQDKPKINRLKEAAFSGYLILLLSFSEVNTADMASLPR
jgi:hypothetical protein